MKSIPFLLWLESFGRQALPFALNYLVQSTLAIGLAALLVAFLQPRQVLQRRAIWLIALFVCILLPVLGPALQRTGTGVSLLAPDDVNGWFPDWTRVQLIRQSTPENSTTPVPAADQQTAVESRTNRGWLALGNLSAVLRHQPEPVPERELFPLNLGFVAIGSLYGIGILAFLVHVIVGTGWLAWVRLQSHPLKRNDLQPVLNDLCQALQLRRPPGVRVSRFVNSPAVFGLAGPVVVLPSVVGTWLDQLQLRFVLAHELCHIRFREYALGLVFRVCQIALFFQPGLGWLLHRLRAESEYLADDVAVSLGRRVGVDPLSYAELLVTMAELRKPLFAERFAAVALVSHESALAQRIDAIMLDEDYGRARFSRRHWLGYGLAGVLVLLTLASIAVVPPPAAAPFPQPQSAATAPDTKLPAPHMAEPFSFEVERILTLPAGPTDWRPRGMVYDQEYNRLTLVGGRELRQFSVPSYADGDMLQPVGETVALPWHAEAVTLVEPVLLQQHPALHSEADGALCVPARDGTQLRFYPRTVADAVAWCDVAQTPPPRTGGPVTGLASVVHSRIPGDLVRISGANEPGQLELLKLQRHPETPLAFTPLDPGRVLDLREPRRNSGILAPLRGVTVDLFEDMLYLVDSGHPDPDTPPGGRVQAYSYAPDVPLDRLTGPFHQRYWSSLLERLIAVAGGYASRHGSHGSGVVYGFDDVYFQRTGDRMLILFHAARRRGQTTPPEYAVAVVRRPHVRFNTGQLALAPGETLDVALLASVTLPAEMTLVIVSSNEAVATVDMRGGVDTALAQDLLPGAQLRGSGPGQAMIAAYCTHLPGEAIRIRVAPGDQH